MDKKIITHFKKVDPKLHSFIELIAEIAVLTQLNPKDYFISLCREIVGQQLSGKAANSIFEKFKKSFTKGITPDIILKKTDQELRDTGISWAKVKYIKDLAQKVKDKTIHLDSLQSMTDQQVIEELTKIKGIGPWTAEMFLMFSLGREDVFSHGDLGLKKGIQKVYNLKAEPTLKQVEKIVSKWTPYKTYACRILWESLEI